MNAEEILELNSEEILGLAVKDFTRNGGVVLASNNNRKTCVGISGSIEEVLEHFSNAFILMNVNFIKKDPEDFKLFASFITSQLLAIAQIAESKWDVPQLSEDTKNCITMGACDKEAVRLAKCFVKDVIKNFKEA